MSRYKVGLLLAVLLPLFSSATGCAPRQDFDSRLQAIADPFRFHLLRWELNALAGTLRKPFGGGGQASENATPAITTYFDNVDRIRNLETAVAAVKAGSPAGDLASLENKLGELQQRNAALAAAVSRQLEKQVRATLSQQGIFNPVDRYLRWRVGFPPVEINLARPPHLLVVSPRERIESLREVTLRPEMGQTDMENIEAAVDALGVSSLVVDLGGLSTYPSYVTSQADLRFTIETIVHEWLHQYLAFTPLGFRYILDLTGLRPDYEIATMNETVVGLVSQEIGAIIYQQYRPGTDNATVGESVAKFDFNKTMRETRRSVDAYLARGEIDRAEAYMEQQRQYLAANGYYLRKLNQAYFAFHGAYADSPTSISPIGGELKTLRGRSASLKSFLDTVAVMTSPRDLEKSVR